MKDLYVYHALLTLMTIVRLDRVDYYWYPPDIITWSGDAAKIPTLLPIAKYYKIRRYLRAYKMIDGNNPERGVGWKVVRATDEIHRIFKTTLKNPGRDISIDEGMAAACSTKNPLYVSVNNKPLEGLRFFLAVCFINKICVGLLPDLKQFPKESYENHPGGYAGKIVCTLLSMMTLVGRWYRFWLDNYYNTVDLTDYVLRTYSFCLGGTMQKARKTKLVNFGDAKKPKPSRTYPKGSLTLSKAIGEDIYVYGWMDSSAVYFIDSCLGPGYSKEIFRRNPQGEPIGYQVPEMVFEYNTFMGGVDVFDQIRKKNGNDTQHPTKKYTVRMFEVLWSMCLSQAYNIYRFLARDQENISMNPTQFKLAVINGLLNHAVVVDNAPPVVEAIGHTMMQTEPGSHGDGTEQRKRCNCRNCPNHRVIDMKRVRVARQTTYYCPTCQIFLHPECFNEWHEVHGENFIPSRKVQI
jgi:hypothetical protein